LDSTLAGLEEDAPLSQIETVLRSVAYTVANADPIRRAVVRDALIRRLRLAGVSCPVTLANVAFGSEKHEKPGRTRTLPLFPNIEPWPERVHGGLILEDMVATLRRFVVLSAAAADAEALWCLHTYVHDVAAVSPNLCLSSPEKRCGKTRNLQILGCLVRRPLHTANVTIAAMTRAIDQYGPTLLLDEVDPIFIKGGNTELRGILNAGLYRSNAVVLRCAGDRKESKAFSVWCPKAIALIGRLPTTLEDRSITITLRRRTSEERVEVLHYEKTFAELESIRRKATRWASDHMGSLANMEITAPQSLHDRAQDLWRPLLAIAKKAGGDWPHRAWRAAVELAGAEPPDNSPGVQLLASIRRIFQQRKTDRLSSETLVRALVETEDGPEWTSRVSLTKVQLARVLAPFGIRPTLVHGSRACVSGYFVRDFADAFARYLSN
jgi:hypothetical protein